MSWYPLCPVFGWRKDICERSIAGKDEQFVNKITYKIIKIIISNSNFSLNAILQRFHNIRNLKMR